MKNFAQTLADINGGQVNDRLDRELEKLLNRLADLGGKGSLTLKLNFKTAGMSTGNSSDKVTVSASVESKLPEQGIAPDLFWIGKRTGLSRTHPDQGSLPGVSAVPAPPHRSQPVSPADLSDEDDAPDATGTDDD